MKTNLVGIQFKNFRKTKKDAGIIDASIQFGTSDKDWYVLSWLLKNGFAWVRVYPNDYLSYINLRQKDLVHFHLPSKIEPTEDLLIRLAKIVVNYINIINRGNVPIVCYAAWQYLIGNMFKVSMPMVELYLENDGFYIMAMNTSDLNSNKFQSSAYKMKDSDIWQFRTMPYVIKELDDNNITIAKLTETFAENNKFRPMICIGGNNGGIFTGDDWKFEIKSAIEGIGYEDYTMAKLYPNTYQTMTEIPSGDLKSDGSIDLITDSLKEVFKDCVNISSIPKINNTNKSIDMSYMFFNCISIISLDLSYFNTNNVIDMSYMFCSERYINGKYIGLSSLSELNVSNWNTSNVVNMKSMFYGCNSLTSLDVSNWDTSNVTNMSCMFDDCEKIISLDVSNWDTSNVIDMGLMFYYCKSLTSLDVSNWDTSNVTTMSCMFYGCSSLTTLDVSNWDTSNVIYACNYNIVCNGLFGNCKSLTSLDVSKWNTKKINDLSYCFYGCSSLTSLDVSKWDTSSAIKMIGTFLNCESLTSLDVSNWDTSNVTRMDDMFNNCKLITTLDVSNFDTSNVTRMEDMFRHCESLTTLDVSNFDTSNVTNMTGMFNGCKSLISLDISNWDTSNVTDMGYYYSYNSYSGYGDGMFENCSNLVTIKGIIDMISCTSYQHMFTGCTKLTGVKLKNVPKDFDPSVAGLSAGRYTILSYRS